MISFLELLILRVITVGQTGRAIITGVIFIQVTTNHHYHFSHINDYILLSRRLGAALAGGLYLLWILLCVVYAILLLLLPIFVYMINGRVKAMRDSLRNIELTLIPQANQPVKVAPPEVAPQWRRL